MTAFNLILASLCFVISLVDVDSTDILVTLPTGKIRGLQLHTPSNKIFYGFQGIPYAAPPLGDLRFQAPQPAKSWEGILDATKEGSECINRPIEFSSIPQTPRPASEDCLFINVYTPYTNISNKKLLPVMVWIYGGGFISGSSSSMLYGPDYLVQEDIIFVSFNYRVGPFGFLSTGDRIVPGNAGLKDQNLALKWVNENIHLFGGDKSKITIFGESAGSASVTYHLLSEKSAGLFRAAIAESGTALSFWALNTNPLEYVHKLISQIAVDNNIQLKNNLTSHEILDFLSNQKTEHINNADAKLRDYILFPVLELPHENAFITESSYGLLENGTFNQVPLLIGFNSEEYLTFIQSRLALLAIGIYFDANIENLVPFDLILNSTTNKMEVAGAIKNIYLDSRQTFTFNLGATVRYLSDTVFGTSIIKYAELQSKFTDVYFYKFSYDGLLGRIHTISVDGTLGTVGHAEELPYLFKQASKDLNNYSQKDILTHSRLVKLWTNFAKFLNPTPEVSDLFQNLTWPKLKQQNFQYLNIDENLEIKEGFPRGDSFQQWDEIYNTWGVQPFYTF